MEVHFYLPEKYWPDAARQEAWKEGRITALEQGGKIASAQSWVYQTWAMLQRAGVAVNLTPELPLKGILVGLTGFFSDDFRVPGDVFFAGIVADYLPHAGAHLHIMQNSAHARRLGRSAYMPHWPHPNLIPRATSRGETFETVCFYGDAQNLAPEIKDPAWIRQLEARGVRLMVCSADRWHDYRDADCVIAIRSFGRSPHLHKPATKLYNAWLAGVPFIGGMDSAFAGDGCAGLNFLQASSPQELLHLISRLKDDATLRQKLVASGHEASQKFNSAAILQRWTTLLARDIPALAEQWRERTTLSRRLFAFSQATGVWLDRKIRR